MKIKKISQTAGLVASVVDNLTSTSTIDALSANQGKILNEKISNNGYETGFIPFNSFTNNSNIGGQNGMVYYLTFSETYDNPPKVQATVNTRAPLSFYRFIGIPLVSQITNTGCYLCISVQNLNISNMGLSYMVIKQ